MGAKISNCGCETEYEYVYECEDDHEHKRKQIKVIKMCRNKIRSCLQLRSRITKVKPKAVAPSSFLKRVEQFNLRFAPPKSKRAPRILAKISATRVYEDFTIFRVRLPEFRMKFVNEGWYIRVFGYRIDFTIPTPRFQTRRVTWKFYSRIFYTQIDGRNDIRQIIISCANQAKSEAMEAALLLVAMSTVSFGTSLAAAFTTAFTTFRTSFLNCLRRTAREALPAASGPYYERERPDSQWRNIF